LNDTTSVRHFERLRFHCEVAVVEDAIDRVFDSGLVLDPKSPWKPEDLLRVEPHLYGTTEHAVFVMGLLQHQWENPTGQSFEQWLKCSLLKQQIADPRIRARMANPALDPVEATRHSYYYIQKFDHTLNTGSDYDRSRAREKNELVRRLAGMARKQMNPKPNLDELEHAIKALMVLELEVRRKDNDPGDSATTRIAALSFTKDGDVMVAEELIAHISKTKLMDCVKDVLCHEFTQPKNILYGASRGPLPYAWSVLRILPKKGTKLQMGRGSFFSKEVVKRARNYLKGVDAAGKRSQNDPRALQSLDLNPECFESYFSRTSHSVVNTDLDEWAADQQAERIGLCYLYKKPPIDAPNWNTAPHVFTEAVLQHHEDEGDAHPLVTYPSCLPELEPLVRQCDMWKDKSDNPEKYSLKASFKVIGVKRQRDADEEESKSQADEEMHGAASAAAAAAAEAPKARYDPETFTDDVDQDDEEPDDFEFVPAPKRACAESPPSSQQQSVGYNAFAPVVANVNGAARFTAEQVAEADRMRN
jgi:hypothetical protein